MAKATPRITATAKPRKTMLVGHSGHAGQKVPAKSSTIRNTAC